MALFLPGMTCHLCGDTMSSSSEVISFSPFLADPSDELYAFSDASVHAACFADHPLREQATRWHEEVLRHRGGGRRCAACGEAITDADDVFGTSLLTRDPTSPLHEFNFVDLHQSHTGRWERFDDFQLAMERERASGAWKGIRLLFRSTPARSMQWAWVTMEVRTDRVERSSAGKVFADVFARVGIASFPSETWSDFAVIVLSWFARAARDLAGGTRGPLEVPFMDGPYVVTLTRMAASSWRGTFARRRVKGQALVHEVTFDPSGFIETLLEACDHVLHLCRTRNWWDGDADELRAAADALRREVAA